MRSGKKPPRALFSAYAEVFPEAVNDRLAGTSLLRIRGGISLSMGGYKSMTLSSPHTRRYFQLLAVCSPPWLLFSAYAEVFPSICYLSQTTGTLLRIRGGISMSKAAAEFICDSSPHTRRYFRHPVRHSDR